MENISTKISEYLAELDEEIIGAWSELRAGTETNPHKVNWEALKKRLEKELPKLYEQTK
jgi:hypothetical protein